MKKSYLRAQTLWVPIQRSEKYGNCWQVVDEGKTLELYINPHMVRRVQRPQHAPPGCDEVYSIVDENYFYDFMTKWRENRLILYRGFPGCHFCWPHLLRGELRSEGDGDVPGFTMHDRNDNSVRTRWLPAADDALIAGVASMQDIDSFTDALAQHEPIPVGFTVAISAGREHGLPLCWLNSGEIVVRGPLWLGQYRMHSITWWDAGQYDFRLWPDRIYSFPPSRPFQPGTQHEINDWWAKCQWWVNQVARYDPILQIRKERRAAASEQHEESTA